MQSIVARERPEVMAGRLRLGVNVVDHFAVDALAAVTFWRAAAGHRDTDVDGDGARRLKADDLPAVDMAGFAQLRRPEWWRHDVAHPARHCRRTIPVCRDEGRFRDGPIANAATVHEGLVRQIHQVIEHQTIVALYVDGAAIAGP